MPLWISNFRMSCHLFLNSKVIRVLCQEFREHTWTGIHPSHTQTYPHSVFITTPQKIHSCKHMCGRPGYEARPRSLHQRTAVLIQTCNYQIIRVLCQEFREHTCTPGVHPSSYTGLPIHYVYSQPKKKSTQCGMPEYVARPCPLHKRTCCRVCVTGMRYGA